jgi:hypothetical protein
MLSFCSDELGRDQNEIVQFSYGSEVIDVMYIVGLAPILTIDK